MVPKVNVVTTAYQINVQFDLITNYQNIMSEYFMKCPEIILEGDLY